MMSFNCFVKAALLAAMIIPAMGYAAPDTTDTPGAKELYIPAKVWRVPDNNNYNSDTSEFSYSRMVQGDDIAIFWSKEFGSDPNANPDPVKRFDVKTALTECERFYGYYVNNLKLVQKGNSLTDKYKMLLYVIGGNEGTAFGGGIDDKIGALWTPASRMNKIPYGALAHELGHAFQYMGHADSKHGPGGPVNEMAAQYFLWQVYPEWMTFENYHLVSYLQKTHFAFLHPTNMYHSPYVLEYWSNKHGLTFWGDLCRASEKGEDVVMTYKKMNALNQEQFNDVMFDAARHFITWDMPRVKQVAHRYANQHKAKLKAVSDGWFLIDSANCPQNYGYNGIKLQVPAAGKKVKLEFKGLAGAAGFNAVKTDKAGWRYGFVAYKKDSTCVYGDVYKAANGKAVFKVPNDTEYLWLVVSGAPLEHWPVAGGRQQKAAAEEQWPYQIKLSGTTLDTAAVK